MERMVFAADGRAVSNVGAPDPKVGGGNKSRLNISTEGLRQMDPGVKY
jgi:hypothetical protein